MTLVALLFSIVISSASLAWGYTLGGYITFAIWIIFFGAGWLLAIWQKWNWFSTLALPVITILAALGLWFGFTPGWLFAGGIFALFAWDMAEFRLRLISMAQDDDTRGIERRHLARVSLLTLAGLALASITMLLRLQFTLEWIIFLAAVALLGLAQLVAWFRR